MRICSVCACEKNDDQYYSGYAQCKTCLYQKIKLRRATNSGKIVRQKERRKAKIKGKHCEWQKKYRSTELGKETRKRFEKKRQQTEEGRAKLSAKNAVKYAIKVGKLVRMPCVVCGEKMSQAHHNSYAKEDRLKVVWLCSKHHNDIHNPPQKGL